MSKRSNETKKNNRGTRKILIATLLWPFAWIFMLVDGVREKKEANIEYEAAKEERIRKQERERLIAEGYTKAEVVQFNIGDGEKG